MDYKIDTYGNRQICIGGIGKSFYQDGFPIAITVHNLKDKGIESSLYHIADECLKHGWSVDTTINKLNDEFPERKKDIEEFCRSSYENQREMIFNYLFNNVDEARNFLISKINREIN